MVGKRILLTGANGFLGRYTREAFRRSGYSVVSLVRRKASEEEAGEVLLDFEEPRHYGRLLDLPPCYAIVHLASHVDFSESADEADFFSTQVLATSVLAALARSWNAHLVFSSGSIVYGNQPAVDFRSIPDADNAYGRMKLLGERVVTSSGQLSTTLRFGGIFGRDGPSHLGLNRAITGALRNGMPPILSGSGSGRRNYIYVKDAAQVVVQAVEKRIGGTHLVAGTHPISLSEMLSLVCQTFLPQVPLERRPGDASSRDSLVEPSSSFDMGRDFRSALLDIQQDYVSR